MLILRETNSKILLSEKGILNKRKKVETHREALADVGLSLRRGRIWTHSVVHIAGHVTGILTELYMNMRPTPPRGNTAAVIQLTGRMKR